VSIFFRCCFRMAEPGDEDAGPATPLGAPLDPPPWLWMPTIDADVRYVDVFHTELLCSLCLEVMAEAVCATPCGHSFCQECLRRAILQNAACPQCREPILCTVPNFTLRNLAVSLSVHCHNDGCTAVMPRSELEAHSNECPFSFTLCNAVNSSDPSDRCPFTCASEAERVAHRQECGYVPVQCPDGCGMSLSSMLLTAHASACWGVEVCCTECGAVMTRGQVAQHLCPEEEVQCELCQVSIPRRALPNHMYEAAKVHVDRLAATVTQQDALLQDLRALVEKQATRIDDLISGKIRIGEATTPRHSAPTDAQAAPQDTPELAPRRVPAKRSQSSRAMAEDGPEFEAADHFQGSRAGYVFKMDTQGLGYYKDCTPSAEDGSGRAKRKRPATGR